jgi:hypothetical protein
MTEPLRTDPAREGEPAHSVTGIYVRAQDSGGHWGSFDIAELTRESLLAWLSEVRPDGHNNAVYVVLALLEHPPYGATQ